MEGEPLDRNALVSRLSTLKGGELVEHTNSHKFMLRDDVWTAAGLHDVAAELRAVNLSLLPWAHIGCKSE